MNKLKKIQVLVYLENGRIWPTVKVCNHDDTKVDVLVVNNDLSTVWRANISIECDEEISQVAQLIDDNKTWIEKVKERIKNTK